MKTLWRYLVNHVRVDFNLVAYPLTAVFLTVAVVINYQFDFLNSVVRRQPGFLKTLSYFGFYSFAYFGAALSVGIVLGKSSFLHKREFWIRGALGVFLLSLDSSLPYFREAIEDAVRPEVRNWAVKTGVNLISFITILLPLYLFNRYQKEQNKFYGLTSFRFDVRPYVIMLLIMVPIVVSASFNSGFLRQYPMYKTSLAHVVMNVPEWVTVAGYEFAYGLDFITVELLFRGFFVIGLIHIAGRHAVLMMATLYCFLHFGKPLGEAISSIFGGYILGVIAYETKSIWGGIMVHLGIAWMMEIAAYLQKSL